MQESYLIWGGTLFMALIIIFPFIRAHHKTLKKDEARKKEAVFLGADKTIAQHPIIDEYRCIGCGACVDACPENDVLGIVAGKATIINGLKCVGHGMCAEACPVEGITVGLGDTSKRSDLPFIRENRETNLPRVYIAGELGGLALIKNAIRQGREVALDIAERIKKNPDIPASDNAVDVIIVGAGPSGMSAALTAIENNLTYRLLDQQDPGGTILQYPRKKLVMTKPVTIPFYGTLTKPEYSKEELLDIWYAVMDKSGLKVETGCKLTGLQEEGAYYRVTTNNGSFKGRYVVLALGRRGTPRKLGVPGEDKPKVMYKLIDAETFTDNHILVVGGGDSAVEAAMGLARQKGNRVVLSYRKEKFFRIKRRNQERLEAMIHDKKIMVLYNSHLRRIDDSAVVVEWMGEKKKIRNDYVFIFAGGEPPFELLKQCGIQFGTTD